MPSMVTPPPPTTTTTTSSSPSSTSKAGIASTSTGERHIPASVRPDGSTRKPIKIRPGYKPPEDVEIYKNRTAEAFKTRGSGGVPGAASIEDDAAASATANNKNAKRREARKKAKTVEEEKGGDSIRMAKGRDVESKRAEEEKATEKVVADPEAEKEKEAKKLQKKLRQARELKEKKESGGSLLPEQFEKVIRINELIRLLDQLGFDAQGERKNKTEEKEVEAAP
jgi:partner of Y14 and mago protein